MTPQPHRDADVDTDGETSDVDVPLIAYTVLTGVTGVLLGAGSVLPEEAPVTGIISLSGFAIIACTFIMYVHYHVDAGVDGDDA